LARFDVAYTVSDDGKVEAADTAASRIEIWKAGFRTIPDHPFGLGFGVYAYFVPVYGLEEILHRPAKNAHNDYVLVTVELSILAGLVFIGLLLSMLARSYKVSTRDTDPMMRAFGAGAFGGLIGAMAACLAVSLMLRLDFGGILWMFLGMTARRAVELKPAEKVKRITPVPVMVASRRV
jgi:O-antigen ligase